MKTKTLAEGSEPFRMLPSRRLVLVLTSSLLVASCGGRSAATKPIASARAHQQVANSPFSSTTQARSAELEVRTSFVGEGSLEVRDEKSPASKTRLALEKLDVQAASTGDVVETSVEHVFRNDSNETLEGTFRFPLPEGAILTGLAMEINGKLMEGELVERDKARKIYEQIVDQMQDPALLEWENGQTFKLRVFPIEPKATKRVVLRFVAPLHRTRDGLFFAFRPPTSEAGLTTEKVSITLDGKKLTTTSGKRSQAGDVVVLVSDGPQPDIVSETTKDGSSFWFAHVMPSFAAAPRPTPKAGQALIFLCDRSRSMLEARGLQKKTIGKLIDQLSANDRYTVIAGDVRTRALAGGLHSPTGGEKEAALSFVDAVEPDGASDVQKLLGAAADAIKEAKANGLEPVVVYVGDGTATWGETRASELEKVAKQQMADQGATMHVVLLGKSTDDLTGRALAAGGHGRLLRPKTELDSERAAQEIVAARMKRRAVDVRVEGIDAEGGKIDLPSMVPPVLYEGDEVPVALSLSKDVKAAPAGLRLVGTMSDGRPLVQPIKLADAMPARHVARRWAKAKIERFEREGDAHKEEIIKMSLDHGVMSRYTAFLVLESEEAYAQFKIKRKAKERDGADARVTGADLDGDGRQASVSPDHLQPGDPEVRIPAPADAQSVVVVFPFGETKSATFEPDDRSSGPGQGYWVARFLVDRRTPDGSYEIIVRITHKDGRVEILKLPYVVDTLRPNFEVTVVKRAVGFEIRAKQKLTREEIEAQSPSPAGSIEDRRKRYAHILTDAKRVEVRTPDGQTLSLTHVKLGEFVGTWAPGPSTSYSTGGPAKLRLVAVDRALNESVIDVEIPR